MPITAEAAGRELPELIRRVVDRRLPVEIHSDHGDAVLLSLADYEALQELALYLRMPDTADLLIDGLEDARRLDHHTPDRA